VGFSQEQARRYEDWFETPFGQRADRVEKRILACLLSAFPDTRSLLDVGCGTGHFARWFAERGMVTIGLDTSAPMLGLSRALGPEIDVVVGDALKLPFEDSAFDMVALVTVLEFLEDPEGALVEALRVARMGLLLGVLNSLSPVALWRRARGLARRATYGGARFFSPWGLERLVRRSLGAQAASVRWMTGLYPLSCLDGLTRLPFGAFVGMSVRLEKGG